MLPLQNTYVGSMVKQSMNKILSCLSGSSTPTENPMVILFRVFGFACLISLMEPQMLSLKQFKTICFALVDCDLFWTGDVRDGDQFDILHLGLGVAIKCDGLNPYKMVEMFKNYKPNVPDEFQSDKLYAEPSVEVWAKVKTEKIDRSEFRAKLKMTKYSNDKERIEGIAFDESGSKA